MSHVDSVVAVGSDFEELGRTSRGEAGPAHRYAAIGSDRLRRYGLQFHPEVDDTVHGDAMIGNVVLSICGCRPSLTGPGTMPVSCVLIDRRELEPAVGIEPTTC